MRRRPQLTHGVQTGDVTSRTGVVWARADGPSRLVVEVGGRRHGRRIAGPVLGPDTDFTGKLRLTAEARTGSRPLLTADVHYTAAHHYDPARGSAGEFTPFWEFVSGPLNAGAFGPNELDGTFGPEAVFVAAPPEVGIGPWGGFRFFGEVAIDGDTRVMTVRLRDIDGNVLFETALEPAETTVHAKSASSHRAHVR